jgi:hypothetical protein
MATVQPQRLGLLRHCLLAAIPIVVAAAFVACSSDDDSETAATKDKATPTTEPEDLEMQAEDFVPLRDMTKVRGFYMANPLGHLDEAIAVAENPEGGEYPVGTIIQLVPFEAMVKRGEDFSPTANNWEFFSLKVSDQGTEILDRGGDADVINQFGGSCLDCHELARPEFDFVCEDTHGCEPLPITDDQIRGVQESDPRPST